jgi:hypothetical protein
LDLRHFSRSAQQLFAQRSFELNYCLLSPVRSIFKDQKAGDDDSIVFHKRQYVASMRHDRCPGRLNSSLTPVFIKIRSAEPGRSRSGPINLAVDFEPGKDDRQNPVAIARVERETDKNMANTKTLPKLRRIDYDAPCVLDWFNRG